MDESEHLHIVKTKLWKYGFISITVYIPPLLSIFQPLIPEGETLASWFQRSGSLMVLIGVYAEYKLYSLNDYFDLNNTRMFAPINPPDQYKTIYILITTITAIGILLGTLIWGYGDVIINNT
jgi:hypothetical protein